MEEQLTPLLIETLDNVVVGDRTILNKYYQLFDEKKYLGSNFEKIYTDMEEHYGLNIQSLRYGYDNQEEEKIYQDLIIALTNERDKKQKIKLIPLIIFLDSNRYLYDHLFNIKYFKDFVFDAKDYFINTVKESGIKIQNLDDLPEYHQEKEWFRAYRDGLKHKNFQKIYSLVAGFERGRGFDFDIYTDFLVYITYKHFFNDLIEIVNEKKDMFEIIYLINILNIKETLYLARQSSNFLLKFEATRKSVYFKTNNQYCLNLLKIEQEHLENIIFEFSKDSHLWQEFLDFYLIYPLRSPQIFRPLSKTVNLLEKDKINMLIKSINIDRSLSDDNKEALSSCFLKIENNKIQKYCLEQLFEIWIRYIDDSNDYFSGMVLTDIIDIVIVYVRDFLDKDTIVKDVEEILYELDEIDNRWFKDSSEQNNYFYKQMSKLFVYGFSFEKYELNELRHKIKNICMNSMKLQTESHHDKKTTLQLFDEYVLKDGRL